MSSARSTNVKPVFFSKHCRRLAECHLQDDQQASKGTWKLNMKRSALENIVVLKRDFTGWRTMEPLFESPSVKGHIKGFFILKDVQKNNILRISKSFYARLYDTKTTDSVTSQSFLSSITEVLDDCTQERLDQLLSLDGLTKALESLEKNKAPRSDGLRAELYSALWDLIGQDLLEVCDSMFLAGTMCESMRKGIITLIYKQKWEKETDYLKVLGIWDSMYKGLNKQGEERTQCCPHPGGHLSVWLHQAVPCYTNTKCHHVLRFYLSLLLQRMGLVSVP
eukprot:g42444.t1